MERKLSVVKRKNREISDEEIIKTHLHNLPFGIIAHSVGDQPFINPNLFYYSEEEHIIYFHTRRGSNTENSIKNNPRTCFAVAAMGRLLPAKKALDFNTEYLSVVVFGHTEIVTDSARSVGVLEKYFEKYFAGIDKTSIEWFDANDAQKATVFAMKINEWSCKANMSEMDFPGARYYAEGMDKDYRERFERFL